mmetsp:Transcript_18195/g.44680  ORF Transcript_18195/g.44680 Transcript_18195/m.44680 type:complete len:200 (-) Transcript_18195:212-811(-)
MQYLYILLVLFRGSKEEGTVESRRTHTSLGSRVLIPRRSSASEACERVLKTQTWPSACTPASVRLDARVRTVSPVSLHIASSTESWTVGVWSFLALAFFLGGRSPSSSTAVPYLGSEIWDCQPQYMVPSYSTCILISLCLPFSGASATGGSLCSSLSRTGAGNAALCAFGGRRWLLPRAPGWTAVLESNRTEHADDVST